MHERRTFLRTAAAHGALALFALPLAGCFGSFSLTRKIWSFNDEASDSKWIKWVLFLAFIVVPIYSIGVLVDLIVLNTIEFFTGSNPMKAKVERLPDGHELAFERVSGSRVRIVHSKDGVVMRVFCIERDGDRALRLVSERDLTLASVRDEGGGASLARADGTRVELDEESLRQASDRVRDGASPHEVALSALESARHCSTQ